MVKDSLDEPPDEVAVGTAPVFPLGIHLDQDHISCVDQPGGSAQDGPLGGSIEFQPATPHPVKKAFHAGVVIATSSV
jgi:hypothetical protein